VDGSLVEPRPQPAVSGGSRVFLIFKPKKTTDLKRRRRRRRIANSNEEKTFSGAQLTVKVG
jgi:hypothetical protein